MQNFKAFDEETRFKVTIKNFKILKNRRWFCTRSNKSTLLSLSSRFMETLLFNDIEVWEIISESAWWATVCSYVWEVEWVEMLQLCLCLCFPSALSLVKVRSCLGWAQFEQLAFLIQIVVFFSKWISPPKHSCCTKRIHSFSAFCISSKEIIRRLRLVFW